MGCLSGMVLNDGAEAESMMGHACESRTLMRAGGPGDRALDLDQACMTPRYFSWVLFRENAL